MNKRKQQIKHKPQKLPKRRLSKRNSAKELDVHYSNVFDNNINFKERVIYFNSDVEDTSLDLFLKAFDELERGQNPGPIRIEVSSYGGDVYTMLGIIDRIRCSPCHIITRGLGKIMSAATFILAAGDERYMGANSYMMLHEMSDVMRGTMSQIRREMEHAKDIEDRMYALYEQFTEGRTKAATFKKLCTGRDHYINAEEAMKLGLIDKIIHTENPVG